MLGIFSSLLVAALSTDCLPCCTAEYLGDSGGEQGLDQVSGGCAVLLCPGGKSQSGQCPAKSERPACCISLPAASGNPR